MNKQISNNMLLSSIGVAVVVVGLLIRGFIASDPASRPTIPYKKFDYGAYMRENNGFGRVPDRIAIGAARTH